MAIASNIKGGPRAVRASAALPAAGAYDTEASATLVDTRGARQLEVFVDYTRGAAGGQCTLKVLAYNDDPAPTNGYERTVLDGASLASGVVNAWTLQVKLPVAAGAALERRSVIFDVGTAAYVRVLFAELGVPATPGTVAATATVAF